MEKKKNISMMVIRRLPKYHRYLYELINKKVYTVSSVELGRLTGFTAVQVRQDLNNFGDFGYRGTGYNVMELYNHICEILNLKNEHRAVIIGAGNLGQAIANYKKFDIAGFKAAGIFDVNPKILGTEIGGLKVQNVDDMQNFMKENQIEIGVICVPVEHAQNICDTLVTLGIKGIWNFAPIDLTVPENVVVENVHLSSSLLTLTYLLNQDEENEELQMPV